MNKQVLLIGGPNGAGKTTVALTLLPDFLALHEFVNADAIAHGLNLLDPDGQAIPAARLMIKRMDDLVQQGKSFALESTCAGIGHIARLQEYKALGYEFHLIFLWLPDVDTAIKRVKQRVKSGGHGIPPQVIRRRYAKGLKNLVQHYLPLADYALICDSSGPYPMDALILEKPLGKTPHIHNTALWQHIVDTHAKENT